MGLVSVPLEKLAERVPDKPSQISSPATPKVSAGVCPVEPVVAGALSPGSKGAARRGGPAQRAADLPVSAPFPRVWQWLSWT